VLLVLVKAQIRTWRWPERLKYVVIICHRTYNMGIVKGKVVPLRSLEAHFGDRRYSSYSFLTSALEGGEWSASRPGRALPPGKESPVPIVQEVGWAPEPVWTQRLEERSFASVVDRTAAVQSAARHCTDWDTRLLHGQCIIKLLKK
jgi:hypothetical protein